MSRLKSSTKEKTIIYADEKIKKILAGKETTNKHKQLEDLLLSIYHTTADARKNHEISEKLAIKIIRQIARMQQLMRGDI